MFKQQSFDLVILDLMIPAVSGVTVTERIRTVSEVPIMMITALSEEGDRVRGLETGADDYVTKPFSPREFTLRALALVRRWRGGGSAVVRNGALEVDAAAHRVFLSGRRIGLPGAEERFLGVLAAPCGGGRHLQGSCSTSCGPPTRPAAART